MVTDEKLRLQVFEACEIIRKRARNPIIEDINRETVVVCQAVSTLREIAVNSKSLPSSLRDQIVFSLKSLLVSTTNQVLLSASYLLGDMKAIEALPELLDLLKSDAEEVLKIHFWADPFGQYEESIQEIGCNALARMNAVEAIPEIEKLLSNADENVRACAAEALRVLRS